MKRLQGFFVLLVVLLFLPGLVSGEGTESSGILLVPPTIDGQEVTSLRAAEIPEDVHTVFLPRKAELSESEALDREIVVYNYMDYDMIHAQYAVMYQYAFVGPGEYALTDAYRYLPGGGSEPLKQEYYEYPTELNGIKVTNCLIKNEYFTLYTDYASGCVYYKLSESEIGVCRFLGGGKNKVTIPDQIDGLTVVAVNSLNSERVINSQKVTVLNLPSTLRILGNFVIFVKNLAPIKIPEGVTEIGSYSVYSYTPTKITLPSTVTRIGVNAFDTGMTEMKIPESVDVLPDSMFSGSSYKKITLQEGLETIPANLCRNCKKLVEVVIPGSVTQIRKNAFLDCINLKRIVLPDALEEMEENAFAGCRNMKEVQFKGDLIRKIAKGTFSGCGIVRLTLPDGLEEIGEEAFQGNSKLVQATIPASVQKIADNAFDNCSKNLVFFVPEGSYAKEWAESKGMRVKETR